ncbi:MAG TPA: hypothetical protein VG034_06715 [Acidimicrobiia bacterium]|jgi:hypothetical protein|nr:hypothetical protein [Acidimicrobiia bacterium]
MRKVYFVAAANTALVMSVAGIGLSPVSANIARAAEQAAAFCGRTGQATITPGLTMIPKRFSVADNGTIGPCQMPDGSTQSGTVAASGRGTGSCGSVTISGTFTISWSSGKTSTGAVEVVSAGPAFFITGTVAEGLFAGEPVISVIFPTAADPSACASTGLQEASYQGVIGFAG